MKKMLNIVSTIMIFVMTFGTITNYAAVLYQPTQSTNVASNVDVLTDLSKQIKNAKTIQECKEIVLDPMQLDYVTFGEAALTADPSLKNSIEWLVLAKNQDNAILVSRKVLDKCEYYEENNAILYTGSKISKKISDFLDKNLTNKEKEVYISQRMLTKTDIDLYFRSAITGSANLALADYARDEIDSNVDYWLKNEEESTTGWYFSNYGNYSVAQLGEKYGVRPVITVKYNPNVE